MRPVIIKVIVIIDINFLVAACCYLSTTLCSSFVVLHVVRYNGLVRLTGSRP
jgi:hypothetical protein